MEFTDKVLELLQKYLSGDLSPEESADFDIYLDLHPELKEYTQTSKRLKEFLKSERSRLAIEDSNLGLQQLLNGKRETSYVVPVSTNNHFIEDQLRHIQIADRESLEKIYNKGLDCILSFLKRQDGRSDDIRNLIYTLNIAVYELAKKSFIYQKNIIGLKINKEKVIDLIAGYFYIVGEENIAFEFFYEEILKYVKERSFLVSKKETLDKFFSQIVAIWNVLLSNETEEYDSFEYFLRESIWNKELKVNLLKVQKELLESSRILYDSKGGNLNVSRKEILNKTDSNDKSFLTIERGSQNKIATITTENIIYLSSSESGFTQIVLESEPKTLVSLSDMEKFHQKLPSSQFIRVHVRHIINRKYVENVSFEKRVLIMTDGKRIPVERRIDLQKEMNLFVEPHDLGVVGKNILQLIKVLSSPNIREDLIKDLIEIIVNERKEGSSKLEVTWYLLKTLFTVIYGRLENLIIKSTNTDKDKSKK